MFKRSLIHQIFLWVLIPIALITSFTYFQLNGLVNHYSSYDRKSMENSLYQIDSNFRTIINTTNQIAALYAGNEDILSAVQQRNADSLFQTGRSLVESGLADIFIVTDNKGVVLARGHDEFRFNDSLRNDPYYRLAAIGNSFSGIGMMEGNLSLISVRQIRAYDTLFIGTLILGKHINFELLDGMEKALRLDINIMPNSTLVSNFSTSHPNLLSLRAPLRIPTLDKSFYLINITKNIIEEQKQIKAIKNRVLLLTFVVAVLSLGFVYMVVNTLLRPMRKLDLWLRQYNSGELMLSELVQHKGEIDKKNELSNIVVHVLSTLEDLESAKNKMSRQTVELRKTREEALRANKYLEDLKLTLEHQVENRTRQLFNKNKELLYEIDERHAAEDRIEALNNTLESIINKMPSCLVGIDPEGKISFWNAGSERQSGQPLLSVRGTAFDHALALLGIDHGLCEEIVKPENQNSPVRKEVCTPNGTRHISVVTFPYSAGNELAGTVVRIDDISKQVWMEQALLQAEKLNSIGVLAGGIAHDFNNLLTAILGSISLCLRDPSLSAKTADMLAIAEKASYRAKGLTNQLLTFSKGGNPVKEETDLKEIIQEYTAFATLGDRIECRFEFSENLWHVLADKDQIFQVFQNIINNAVQAIQSEQGLITVSCKNLPAVPVNIPKNLPVRQYIEIVIRDNGQGMTREVLDKVFDPYFTTKQQGNGLGLAICHSIIHKHNGLITVESKIDEGTTFTIYLPAVEEPAMLENASDEQKYAAGVLRILVMDDDPIVRGLLREILTELGHQPSFAADGEEAIACYTEASKNQEPVDVIIMDLTVTKGMGGKECAAHILAIDPAAKIIVSSGYSRDPIMENYEQYGFCGAVPKPYRVDEMRQAIEKAVNSNQH